MTKIIKILAEKLDYCMAAGVYDRNMPFKKAGIERAKDILSMNGLSQNLLNLLIEKSKILQVDNS